MFKHMHRHVAMTAAILLTAGALAACGSGSDSGAASAGEGGGEAAAELEPLLVRPDSVPDWPVVAERPPAGKQVYYINTGHGSAQPIEDGIRGASEALGWEYHALTYNAANPATGNSAYLSAVSSGADVIVSTGLVEASITEGLEAAHEAGIQVVLISNSDPPDSELYAQVGNLQVNLERWSEAAVLGIVADAEAAGTTAKVGVVSTSGIPVIQANADAFVEAMNEICPDCEVEIIDVPAADFTTGQTPETVVSFMQRNPDVEYIHVMGGDFQGGLRPALDGAGLADVKISGTLPGPAQNAEIESGDAIFWVQVPNEYHGWVAMDSAVRSFTGGDPMIHNEEQAPLWVVNADNLDFDPGELPDYPEGYREEFRRLWALG